MFDAAFLIAVRKYVYLLVYLLMLIPVLNFFIYIAFKIYLGVKGHELARDSETFDSAAERTGFLKGIDWAGKVMFFVLLAIFALSLILVAFGVADVFSELDRIEQDINGNQPGIEAQLDIDAGIDNGASATQTPATQTPTQ